jgi:hypothetical protein
MTRDIEPTPEDFEAARKSLERDPREVMLEILAKQEARRRIEHERLERRRRFLRRFVPFRRRPA